MRELLESLLPRFFPGLAFLCVAHEGKSDLDRSIPRKLQAWKEPGVRFIVVRDNDNANCLELKRRLLALCQGAGRPDTLVRLVCQELESWFIGDLEALGQAFEQSLNTPKNRKRFLDPDGWQKPSVELERIVPSFQKRSGARAMSQRLRIDGNKSRSFQHFVSGVSRVATEMGFGVDHD